MKLECLGVQHHVEELSLKKSETDSIFFEYCLLV